MIDVYCTYNSSCTVPFKDLEAPLSNRIARLGDEVHDFVPNGFQAMVEIEDSIIASENARYGILDPEGTDDNPTVFRLCTVLGTDDSFTIAKNWTLAAATGDMIIEELLDLIKSSEKYDENDPMLQEIRQFENVSQLLRRHHEWLRDVFYITISAGGIRVPFVTKAGFEGELRIAFSALTEEQNICMCILILRQVQAILKDILSSQNDWAEYDLSKLKQNKKVNFYLAQYGINQIVI